MGGTGPGNPGYKGPAWCEPVTAPTLNKPESNSGLRACQGGSGPCYVNTDGQCGPCGDDVDKIDTSAKRVEEVNMWKVGDRAVWQDRDDCTVKAVGPDFCVIIKDGSLAGQCVFTTDLTRPAPRKRTVTVLEYEFVVGEGTFWTDREEHSLQPTGRTHTFEVEDADGDQG